jgi:hypothetical protein
MEEGGQCWWKQSLHVLKNSLAYDRNDEIHWNEESSKNKYIRLQQWNTFRSIELKFVYAIEESSAVESKD